MQCRGRMNFFEVEQCGLYSTGSKDSHGCGMEETFNMIHSWVKGRPFSSTIPWDPDRSHRNRPKVYCKDIYKSDTTGDYVIVLWKSDLSGTEGLLGVPEDDLSGSHDVIKHSNNHNGKKVIWGRPCYYWVVPNLNLVVSIKFDHSLCDSQLFQDYISSCMTNRVKHPNRVKEFTDSGYVRLSYVGEEGVRYRYSFSMGLKMLSTESAELSELASKVTHIVRRDVIKVDSPDERAEWIKMFDKITRPSAKPKSKYRKIEVKAEANLSVAELKEIIEKNATDGEGGDSWVNVGFDTEDGLTWVDTYRLKETILVNINSENFIPAGVLGKQLEKARNGFLRKVHAEMDATNLVEAV